MNIGDKIQVKVRSIDANINNKTGWKEVIMEGVVVKGTPHLDPPNTFCLLTGNPEFPISIINLSSVVDYKLLGVSCQQLPNDRTRFVIFQSKNGDHKIRIHNSGYVACDCIGFHYRRRCSHRDSTLQWLTEKYGTDWKKSLFK